MSQSIITLLSDLGTAGPSIPVAKAAFMGFVPGAVITDISHNIPVGDLRQAAMILHAANRYYSEGTAHIIMADVMAGHHYRLMLARKEGQWFIAPDNGILPLAFGEEQHETWLCHEFSGHFTFGDWTRQAGILVEMVCSGNPVPFPFSPFMVAPHWSQPVQMTDCIECSILCIDRYDNVVLDITKDHFENALNGWPFSIKMMRLADITSISNNYNDAPRGGALCRFNMAGYLEIAVNHGSASALLGLRSDDSASLGYRTIKIYTSKTLSGNEYL